MQIMKLIKSLLDSDADVDPDALVDSDAQMLILMHLLILNHSSEVDLIDAESKEAC